MYLPFLFHWSPSGRRQQIAAEGLKPGCPPVISSTCVDYLCLASSPAGAWDLSAGLASGQWDLWQVTITDDDEVHVLPVFGPGLGEVRIFNAVPPQRLWFSGTRHCGPQPRRTGLAG